MLWISKSNIDSDTPLIGVGIDFSVAVKVRNWFLKELGVDIPILDLLSSATLAGICWDALPKLTGMLTVANSNTPLPTPSQAATD